MNSLVWRDCVGMWPNEPGPDVVQAEAVFHGIFTRTTTWGSVRRKRLWFRDVLWNRESAYDTSCLFEAVDHRIERTAGTMFRSSRTRVRV